MRDLNEMERSSFNWTLTMNAPHPSEVIIEHMLNRRWNESMFYSIISQICNNFHQHLNYRNQR